MEIANSGANLVSDLEVQLTSTTLGVEYAYRLCIPEGEEGAPPSPNATEPGGSATEVAQKAAEIQRLPSAVKSGKRSGGASWLTHSGEYALAPWHFRMRKWPIATSLWGPKPDSSTAGCFRPASPGEGDRPAAATRTQG